MVGFFIYMLFGVKGVEWGCYGFFMLLVWVINRFFVGGYWVFFLVIMMYLLLVCIIVVLIILKLGL